MWVYLCLWRLQPYDRNSELCPRHSRSLGKWKNSPPLQMWCPVQDGEMIKKKNSLGKKKKKPVTNQKQIVPAVLPEILEHYSPVKNQPYIVMTRAVTTNWHLSSSSAVEEEVGRGSRRTWMNDVPRTERGTDGLKHTCTQLNRLTAATVLMSLFAK